MPTLEVLVGMIGSGKSTYARKRADEGALVICHDDLTAMLHVSYRYEQGLRECYRRMEEALASEVIRAGRDAVIDRTHLTRESRRRWIDWANNHDVGSCVIAVAFPIEFYGTHAVRRYNADSRGRDYTEWLKVAYHHAQQARDEPLSEAEGFAEIRHPSMEGVP